MPNTRTWLCLTGLLAAALVLQAGAALAQDVPAAQAPGPPAAAAAEDAPALPDDAKADRKARVQALRERWQELAAGGGARANGIQMHVQGDSVYILYGTVLLQLSAETLELKAKVDVRELVLGDRELAKKLRKARPDKQPKATPAGEEVAAPPPAEQ